MVQVTLSSIVPSGVPLEGWIVGYRIKGSLGAYTVLAPQMSFPIIFNTTDAGGTLYEGYIKSDCGALESINYFWTTPCSCIATYSPTAIGDQCQKVETIAATVTNSGYCLAASTDTAYGDLGMRVYALNFVSADLLLAPGTIGGAIVGNANLAGQWANPTYSSTIGPLNREGVWIDSTCNGSPDALSSGTQTTIAFLYNNLGAARTIYVGIAADNRFQLKVNEVVLADSTAPLSGIPFKLWHVLPINIVPGVNYINGIAFGDGSVNDSIGMVIYDNTPAQLLAATSDVSLNILFKTSTLRGTTFDVATCPTGYSLDTSGGAGSYVCRRTIYRVCNSTF